MTGQDTTPDTITLRLIEHGEETIEVDRAEYEQDKADGNLVEDLYEWTPDGIPTGIVIIEPDGTLIDPWSDAPPRTSLLGRNVTAGVAAIIAAAPADSTCEACDIYAWRPCARHIAEHLVEAARQERLIIVSDADADAVLARAVANATDGGAL